MVVLQSHVPFFQGLPGSAQWVTSGSCGHDCRFHLREYNRGELSGCLGKRDQRMEQFQEISHQGWHVPICLQYVRQDLDQIKKSRTRHSSWGGQFSDQDADLWWHHHWFIATQKYHRCFQYVTMEGMCFADGCPHQLMLNMSHMPSKNKKPRHYEINDVVCCFEKIARHTWGDKWLGYDVYQWTLNTEKVIKGIVLWDVWVDHTAHNGVQ